MLKIDNLNKSFSNKATLRDINLKIELGLYLGF